MVGGVGYHIKEDDHSGRVNWIFFHPNFTGKGLGTKAVEYCMHRLQTHPKIEKLIVRTSQLAFQFFEKFGYQIVKIEKDYWGEGLDLYLMEIDLVTSGE